MGLADLISNAFKGNRKSLVSTSKSIRPNSMVSSSKTSRPSNVNKTRGLPRSWNKDGFHPVTIIITETPDPKNYGKPGKYVGYIWATNYWVELHCFKSGKKATINTPIPEHRLAMLSKAERECVLDYRSKNVMRFKNHELSAIVPRDIVEMKDKDVIIVPIKWTDLGRWNEWHPDDDYRIEIEYKIQH